MRQLSVARLLDDNREKLCLRHLTGPLDSIVSISSEAVFGSDLVGYLNVIHPERVQVFGKAELEWSRTHPRERVVRLVGEILAAKPPAFIIADDVEVSRELEDASGAAGVALLASPAPAVAVIDGLRTYLARELGQSVALHGVAMDVLGMGVLITGDSGVGKSELALELLSRGHGLVADDVVEINRYAANAVEGHSPAMLRDFLEVRGLGVLNIRTIFGESACRRRIRIRLWVHLQRPVPGQPEASRLPLDEQTQDILGVPVRKVVIPVAAGRNLAVLVEAAVRSTILLLRGIDPMAEFIERQRKLMQESSP